MILIISGVNGANRALRNQDIRRFGQINIGLDGYRNPITLYGMTHNVTYNNYRIDHNSDFENPHMYVCAEA